MVSNYVHWGHGFFSLFNHEELSNFIFMIQFLMSCCTSVLSHLWTLYGLGCKAEAKHDKSSWCYLLLSSKCYLLCIPLLEHQLKILFSKSCVSNKPQLCIFMSDSCYWYTLYGIWKLLSHVMGCHFAIQAISVQLQWKEMACTLQNLSFSSIFFLYH